MFKLSHWSHHPSAWWCSPPMWPPVFTTNWTLCNGRCLKCLNVLYTSQAFHYVICTSLDQPSKAICLCRTMMCRMLWYSNLHSRATNSLQMVYANICIVNGTLSKYLCWHFHYAYSQINFRCTCLILDLHCWLYLKDFVICRK